MLYAVLLRRFHTIVLSSLKTANAIISYIDRALRVRYTIYYPSLFIRAIRRNDSKQ